MKKYTSKLILGLMMVLFGLSSAQNYKITSSNLVVNSSFNGNPNGNEVPNWSFNPAGNADGWRKEKSLLYGEYIFIDRVGTHTATPALSATPCANLPKVVKFYYNEANTGPYSFNVKLGGQTIASFSQKGGSAQSNLSFGAGVTAKIDRKFILEGTWGNNYLWNNIWHEVELYVPAYTSGNLVFESIRNGGISRQIRLDNVGLYEAIPTPIPTNTSVNLASCTATTYNLTTLNPTDPKYTYTWYKDAAGTQPVATPTAATVGNYYLFASTSCNNNGSTKSNASLVVSVKAAPGCCNARELIKNGDFSTFTTSGTSSGGVVNGPKLATANPWVFDPSDYSGLSIGSFLGGNTVLGVDPNLSTLGEIYQKVNACPGDRLNMTMTFGMTKNAAWFQTRDVIVTLGNVRLYTLRAYSNTPSNIQVTITNIGPNVSNLKVDGTPYSGQILNKDQLYNLTADIQYPTSAAANPNFMIAVNEGAVPFLDNISLVSNGPSSQNPTSATGNTSCPSGLFNLNTVTPTTAGFVYEWHVANDPTSPLVDDISKVGPGTYYMLTRSLCSGCPAASLVPFTVTQGCPTVSGKVFADYDGTTVNGISNPGNLGESGGGLYALLVNNSNTVVNSVKINTDGTFSLNGTTAGSGFYVMLNNSDVAIGTAAPATAQLNPNYINTGSAINSTTPVGVANGKSPVFALTQTGTVGNVYFGLNSPPIAADATGDICTTGPGVALTTSSTPQPFPTLYGVDDDPNFNNGVGKKIIIKTVTTTNGSLSYNGTAVANNTTINSYDPTLFSFTPTADGDSRFAFTYVFEDASGTQSLVDGQVNYGLQKVAITGANTVAIGSTLQLTGSQAPAASTPWASSNTAVATISDTGLVTPVSAGTTTITYTNSIGCTATATITVKPPFCYKPGAVSAGTTVPSKMGITTLTRAGGNPTNGWPMIRQSAHMVIEAKGKGFVITRMASPETSIANPVVGMMVFDTDENNGAGCLKINTDGTSAGWKCFNIQSCDN